MLVDVGVLEYLDHRRAGGSGDTVAVIGAGKEDGAVWVGIEALHMLGVGP